MRILRLASWTFPLVLGSCALETAGAPAAMPGPAQAFPKGFASLDAMCVAENARVRPSIEAAEARRVELISEGSMAPPVTAHCEVSKTALEHANVMLRAPFLEVTAIDIETGNAVETHLATRTESGWFLVAEASLSVWHEDPGCFSIERDAAITSIRVEAEGTLVVTENRERGAKMEEIDGPDGMRLRTWTDTHRSERGCRLESSGLSCAMPVVVHVARTMRDEDGDHASEVLFDTTTHVSPQGELVPARIAEPKMVDPYSE